MGQCKQLLPLGERTALARNLEALLAAGVGTVVVVVGPNGAAVAAAARRYPVQVVVNPETDSDMAASLRVGFAALPATAAHVVVALCDHPLVAATTVATLLAIQRQLPGAIVVPICAGRRGHPVILPRDLLAKIVHYPTLRDVLGAHVAAVHLVEVSDEAVVLDMDTPEDYARLLQRCPGHSHI
ncbi:MAG TPA: nucleotidyltransferase family protein [Desulfuromonas sp.]|nr:nucleotidyltransferase family protein [Desulfuromonas sp.]HBT82803.1 nucleotidyltransferase family protein [Desulfuromonas sp.]